MLTTSRGNRKVAAMLLNIPVNGVCGIVQCMVPGCEAHIVLMQDDGNATTFIDQFMMIHDCDPKRFAAGHRRIRRRVGRA